ncbi:MAG: hypothetical protein NUW02_02055 [Candidatus Campbellbacteria bacterium]|nr:hypothetical protein [Candidatus Campbellbacteria bacterium]
MSDIGIAELLLHGSANIDLMRKRILQLISMIIGLVHLECDRTNWKPDGVRKEFTNSNCHWSLGAYRNRRGEYVMVVGVRSQAPCSLGCQVFSTDETLMDPLYVDEVLSVYENLDVFVEGMVKEFPSLERGLYPFAQAGKKEL